MIKLKVCMLIAVVVLAGCDAGTERAPGASEKAATPGATASVPAALVTKVVSDNGMLTVDPAVIDACVYAGGVVASDVNWNATAAGTEGVDVFLQNPDGQKKLWTAAGAVAGEKTGPWMREGSEVILVNGTDKQELARVRITARACTK